MPLSKAKTTEELVKEIRWIRDTMPTLTTSMERVNTLSQAALMLERAERVIAELVKEGCSCDLLYGWTCNIHEIARRDM